MSILPSFAKTKTPDVMLDKTAAEVVMQQNELESKLQSAMETFLNSVPTVSSYGQSIAPFISPSPNQPKPGSKAAKVAEALKECPAFHAPGFQAKVTSDGGLTVSYQPNSVGSISPTNALHLRDWLSSMFDGPLENMCREAMADPDPK